MPNNADLISNARSPALGNNAKTLAPVAQFWIHKSQIVMGQMPSPATRGNAVSSRIGGMSTQKYSKIKKEKTEKASTPVRLAFRLSYPLSRWNNCVALPLQVGGSRSLTA